MEDVIVAPRRPRPRKRHKTFTLLFFTGQLNQTPHRNYFVDKRLLPLRSRPPEEFVVADRTFSTASGFG